MLLLGPLLVAVAVLPHAAVAAWPLWALTFAPMVAATVAALPFRLARRLAPATLPEDAAAWVRRRLDARGLIGVTVATIERSTRAFYHAGEQTIVLPPTVHRHTAAAYAVAAHELGHAIVHHQHPRLGRLLLAARGYVDRVFAVGVALLLGGALTAAPAATAVGLAACALALVLAGLVLVDELAANLVAVAELRPTLDAADLGRARRRLAAALASYVAHVAALALPLGFGRWLLARGVALDVPARVPTGALAALTTGAAVVVVLGAAAALRAAVRPPRASWLPMAARVWAVLLAAALLAHPGAPAWAVVLAVIPAWALLATPGWLALGLITSALPDPTADALARTPSTHPGVRRITMATLAPDDDEAPRLARLAGLAPYVWPVPLAIWWLIA